VSCSPQVAHYAIRFSMDTPRKDRRPLQWQLKYEQVLGATLPAEDDNFL